MLGRGGGSSIRLATALLRKGRDGVLSLGCLQVGGCPLHAVPEFPGPQGGRTFAWWSRLLRIKSTTVGFHAACRPSIASTRHPQRLTESIAQPSTEQDPAPSAACCPRSSVRGQSLLRGQRRPQRGDPGGTGSGLIVHFQAKKVRGRAPREVGRHVQEALRSCQHGWVQLQRHGGRRDAPLRHLQERELRCWLGVWQLRGARGGST